MASIVRLASLRCRLSPLRGFLLNSLRREISHVTAVGKTTAHRCYSFAGTRDLLVSRYASFASPIANETPNDSTAEVHQRPSGSPLIDLLKQLDDQVRRWGRVDREHVQRLLDLVSKNGSVSTQQSIMILRCTGSLLVKESPAERNALFERAKKVLQSVGAEMNVQVYNAMLRAKLENKQPFSPVEILSEMETEKKLLPNRVTYQLLLSQFCENGDIEGASTILEHMKSQNLPVNENIFNALVKGHVKKGDFAGAKTVLTTMGDFGMDPTADTYRTLICGFAESGDLAGMQQSLEDAENASIKFYARHLYDIVIALTSAGHNESIDKILSYIEEKIPRHNQDSLNCIFQLVAEGFDDVAFRVFNSMDHSTYQGHQGQSPGTVLMRVMIIKGRPIEKVLEIHNKLQAENKISGSLEEIANMALRYQHSGYALKVLEEMEKAGCEIKQHYFWPVLKDAADRKDVKGAMETISSLVSYSKGKDDLIVGSVFRWAIKPLLQKGKSLETLVSGVRDAGLPEAEVEMLQIAGLLSSGKLEEAAKLINTGTKFSPAILKSELVLSFSQSKFNSTELVKVIQAVQGQLPSPFVDGQSGILLGILKNLSLSQDTATKLINEWVNADLELYKNFEKPIKQELQRLGVTLEELTPKLDHLFVDQFQKQIPLEELKKASIEEMEQLLEKSKGQRVATMERTLLLKYGRAGLVDKADALKRTLDQRGFIYGPDILRTLGTLAAKEKQNLEEALAYKHQLEVQHPSFGAYANLVLHIAKLQLKAKKFDEAWSTLQNFSSRHSDNLEKFGASDGYGLVDLCRGLLVACSEEFDPLKVQQLCDFLCQNGFVKEDTVSLKNQVLNAYIKRGDADEILSVLETYVTKLNEAPQFSDVFKLLIEKEDANRLQRAVDLVTTVIGEMSTLLHLVASFIECGKTRQARKVLETPGLRALMKPLIEACERFLTSDKEKELELLVEYTKTLPGIDRDEMLLQLMRLYAKRKDAKKMMEVFSLYEEERVRPRPRTLRYIAKVLESQGHPVPFEVLPAERALEESSQPAPSAMETEAQEAFKEKDVAKVMEIKGKMDAQGEELSSKFVTNVARFLLTRKDNQMFRKFAHQLAESGDTAGLLSIRKLTLSKNLEKFVHQRLFLAYLHRNKIEELLDYLTENPEHLSKYLTMNAINMLSEKKPELMNSLVSIIETDFEKSGKIQVAGLLYNFYMINGEYEQLDNLLKKFPALKDRVRLSYVCQMARRLQKDDILQKVIEIHPSETPRRLIVPFNQMLLLKCDQGDWTPALQCYKSALNTGLTFEDFWVRSLQTLGSLLEGNGQPLPWQPGMLEKRAAGESSNRRRDASSSSDDSSSDSEKEDVKEIPKSHFKV